MTIVEDAHSIAADLVAVRRQVHRAPELGLHLPRTQQVVLAALAGLPVEITLGQGLSSVVGVIRGEAPGARTGPVILLRADMDALPVLEEPGDVVCSEIDGLMHACGHDLHVAGLIGAARLLCDRRSELAGDVVLMFQPAEEGPGGAEPMLAEGLLDVAGRRVDAAYAVHVYSADYPRGVWFSRPGTLMAAADEVRIVVQGKGGHGSAPHRALDPVPVACEIVLALQAMVTRRMDIFDPVVVTVGRIAGGTKDNIIADEAQIEATVRTFSVAAREQVRGLIDRVAEGVCAAHGLTARVTWSLGYPPTVNDAAELAFAQATVVDLFGAERWAEMPFPEAGAEDFAFVLQEVPGAYVNIAACVGDLADAEDNHSPRARFDESVLPDMAALLAELALRRARRGAPPVGLEPTA